MHNLVKKNIFFINSMNTQEGVAALGSELVEKAFKAVM